MSSEKVDVETILSGFPILADETARYDNVSCSNDNEILVSRLKSNVILYGKESKRIQTVPKLVSIDPDSTVNKKRRG